MRGSTVWLVALLLAAPLAQLEDAASSKEQPGGVPEAAGAKPTVREETVRELVEALRDDAKREQLVDRLEAMISLFAVLRDESERQELIGTLQALLDSLEEAPPPDEGAPSPLEELGLFFQRISERLQETALQVVEQAGTVPERTGTLAERLRDPKERTAILRDAGMAIAVVAASLASALVASLAMGRVRQRLARPTPDAGALDAVSRVGWGLVRSGVDLLPPGVGVGVAFGGLALLPASPSASAIALAVVLAFAVHRALFALVRLALRPHTPELRLVAWSDAAAIDVARGLQRLIVTAVYGFFLITIVSAAGAEPELLDPLRDVYGVVLLGFGIVFVLRHRRIDTGEPPESADAQPDETPGVTPKPGAKTPEKPRTGLARWARMLAPFVRLWWIAAILYMLGLYAVWIGRTEGAFQLALRASAITAASFGVAVLLVTVIDQTLDRIVRRLEGRASRLPELRRRIPTYARSIEALLVLIVLLLAAGVALEGWGVGAIDALASPLARSIFLVGVQLFLIVLIAMAIVDAVTAFTHAYLARREKRGRASAKVKTLVPLANKAVKVVVTIVAAIMILSELGVEIAPLLAGVGVLGLAIGFGAQTLVKDIITGVFLLVEDSVSVGDVVNLEGTAGLVEAINIRTIRLRDLHGNVHVIPYSSVARITNMTKEFSRYVADIGVAYREDVDEVMELLREVGEALRQDPELGKDILEPIEIFGLDRFEDSAVVVRVRLTTRPLKQWATGREFLRRVKRAFDDRGIEIPFPHRTIYMGADKDGTAPPLHLKGPGAGAPGAAPGTGEPDRPPGGVHGEGGG